MRHSGLPLATSGSRANNTPCPARCAQNADHLAHNSPFSAFFTEVVCTLGAAPPRTATSLPQNGGNDVIRAATRRRHAERKLLMVQNPHVAARHASKRLTHWPSTAHLCALSSRWSVIWVPRAVLGSAARGNFKTWTRVPPHRS